MRIGARNVRAVGQKLDALKGREREWDFWDGAASPSPPDRRSGGAL